MMAAVDGCAQVNDTELMPALSTAFSDDASLVSGFETIFGQQRERVVEAHTALSASAAAESNNVDAAHEANARSQTLDRSNESLLPRVAALPAAGKIF